MKNKYLTLLNKKNKLVQKLIPILEKFTQTTGLVVTDIHCELDVETIYNDDPLEPKAIDGKIIYKITPEIKL